MRYSVKLTRQPHRHLAVVKFRATVSDMSTQIGAAFGDVTQYLIKNHIPCAGPAVAHYTMIVDGFDVAAGFAVPRRIDGDGHVVPFELPRCEAASTTHVGPYAKLPEAYAAIQKWIVARDRKPAASGMWEQYLDPPTVDPAKMRTEIIWPLQGTRAARSVRRPRKPAARR